MDKDFKKKLQNINPRGLKCTCYRAIAKQYDDPLSTKGNEKVSGRWHIKGEFNALYLCESKKVCIEELKRKVEDEIIIKNIFDLFELEINFSQILDLTSEENLKALEITENELLSGNVYTADEISLPNSLARTAYELGFEGILVRSATMTGNNIVMFPKNQLKDSSIIVTKEKGGF